MTAILARFADPTSPVFGATSTLAFGALSLVDPARLTPGRRRAYRAALATTTAWWTAVTTGRDRTVYVPAHAVAGLLAGGAAWALADASDALDERILGSLRTAGVRRPRRWMAAISAAGVLASFARDRAVARTEDAVLGEDLVRTRPVTPQVREVVRGILLAADDPAAGELLAQLELAQESYFDDGDDGFATVVEFEVPEEAVRVVPHSQVYPVQARFEAPDGTRLQVSLQLHEGRLAHLVVDAVDEDDMDAVEDLVTRWPEPATLRYVRDDADGGSRPLA